MEHYGSALIAILVAVVVLMVLGQIPSRMGELLASAIENSVTGGEGEAYHSYMNVSVPGVTVTNPYGCIVGRMTPLESFLTVDVSEPTSIQMEILSIREEDLGMANAQISTAKDAVWFYSPGIYQLEIRIRVLNGRSRTQMVKIIVNEEEFE